MIPNLNSPRAISVNIEIVRTFVNLRRMVAVNSELAHKLEQLERRYDGQFKVVFNTSRELMKPPDLGKKKQLGFKM